MLPPGGDIESAVTSMNFGANSPIGGSPPVFIAEGKTIVNGSAEQPVPPPTYRLAAIRYYLDKPGYGMHDSAVRLWFNPPSICTPAALRLFLVQEGILASLEHDDHHPLLVEVYLDKFRAFMALQACETAAIEWNLHDTTPDQPGIFNIRLTETTSHVSPHEHDLKLTSTATKSDVTSLSQLLPPPPVPHANSAPIGLFAFSLMVGMETVAAMERLTSDNFIDYSFVLTWGPYMFFSGGGLMTITAILQILRNNIYGAVAFMVFGSFWFANGLKVILDTHFSPAGTIAGDLVYVNSSSDPWGAAIRYAYILAFALTLLKQTFAMNKLSTTLISLLICKFVCQIGAGWSDVAAWIQVVFGWLTSWFAFYVFVVEFTNNVYHREVFPTHKWSDDHSPEEAFGAAGKHHTLLSKASKLREARVLFPSMSRLRSALSHSFSFDDSSHKKKA
jgi:succinate-acetate transporter protein